MTAVLPAWKLELIERRKNKEKNQRQQVESESARKASIPEWKRSLLEKRKDSPEIGEQASCVNSIFGPRIVRKISQTTLPIANTKQESVAKCDEEKDKGTITREVGVKNSSAQCPGSAETNSSVVNLTVGVRPVEVDQKANKHCSQREIENLNRDNTEQEQATEVRAERNTIAEIQQLQTSVIHEPVKRPSDLRRMFEKPNLEVDREFSEMPPAKSTDSSNEVQISTKSTEQGLNVVDNIANSDTNSSPKSQLQITNKSTILVGDNAQSSIADAGLQSRELKGKTSSPPQFAPKPYKSFVTTPPWLRNTTPRNVAFQVQNSKPVQEEAVVVGNHLEEGDANECNVLDRRKQPVTEDCIQEKAVTIVNNAAPVIHNDTVHTSNVSTDNHDDVVVSKSTDIYKPKCTIETNISQRTQLASTQKYTVVKEADVKEEEVNKLQKESGRASKKIVVEHRIQEKDDAVVENDTQRVGDISANNVSDVVVHKSHDLRKQSQKQETAAQKYSVVKESDRKDELIKLQKEPGNLIYAVIDRSQQEPEADDEITAPSRNSAVHVAPDVPEEFFSQHGGVEEKSVASQGDIKSLRSKFGPSGTFHRKYSSEENLSLKGSQLKTGGNVGVVLRQGYGKRPPPPMKRWSADIINLMSRDLDDDLSPRSESAKSSPSNSLNRGRSSSLVDVREEGIDFFQHKPHVSHGIEHRMHKLIRKASVSETNFKADDKEDSDSSSDNEQPIIDVDNIPVDSKIAASNQATTDAESRNTQPPVVIKGTALKSSPVSVPAEQEGKPVFVRKRSIASDIEHRVSDLLQRQVSYSEGEESEGESITGIGTKVSSSPSKVSSVQVTDNLKEPALHEDSDILKSQDKQENDIKSSSGSNLWSTVDDSESSDATTDNKPAKGSVHKLSALFGASIRKSSKKDKTCSEVKSKDKNALEIKTQKISQKAAPTEKEDSKKSHLFSRKTEKKSTNADKQPSNGSIFPWLKKHDKGKESSEVEKTRNNDKSKNENSSLNTDRNDNVLFAAHSLRPVPKPGKVEHQLVGNVVLVSQGSTTQGRSPPRGVYPKIKPSFPAPENEGVTKRDFIVTNVAEKETVSSEQRKVDEHDKKRNQIPAVVTQHWNGNQERRDVNGEGTLIEEVPITSIDEVPVSAIDMPESGENDVSISVIDVPSSPNVHAKFFEGSVPANKPPEDHVNVSVIDMPSPSNEPKPDSFQAGYLESDELSDASDEDETEGSYDFTTGEIHNAVNGDIGEDSSDGDEEEEGEEEDEEEEYEDEEDVPISYIGAAPRFPIPQVVFDSEPVQLKSCLSPKTARKKMNAKVSFKSTHTIHGYPSEASVAIHHEEIKKQKTAELKTLQNYKPVGLVSMENMIGQIGKPSVTKPHVSNGNKEVPGDAKNPEIKYADDGQAFTDSTGHASALLF